MDFKVIFLTEKQENLTQEKVENIITKHFGSPFYSQEVMDDLITTGIVDRKGNLNTKNLKEFLERKVTEKFNKVKNLIIQNDYWKAYCETNSKEYVFLVKTEYGYETLDEISMYQRLNNWNKSYYFVDVAICYDGAGM